MDERAPDERGAEPPVYLLAKPTGARVTVDPVNCHIRLALAARSLLLQLDGVINAGGSLGTTFVRS